MSAILKQLNKKSRFSKYKQGLTELEEVIAWIEVAEDYFIAKKNEFGFNCLNAAKVTLEHLLYEPGKTD